MHFNATSDVGKINRSPLAERSVIDSKLFSIGRGQCGLRISATASVLLPVKSEEFADGKNLSRVSKTMTARPYESLPSEVKSRFLAKAVAITPDNMLLPDGHLSIDVYVRNWKFLDIF